MSDSVRPHRRQPTRLPHPWDSPSKNTGVGCHFLLQCMKVKSESEVAQSCPTPSDPMDCSLPASSVHGIFQARVLEWVPPPSPIVSHTHPYLELQHSIQFQITLHHFTITHKGRLLCCPLPLVNFRGFPPPVLIVVLVYFLTIHHV